MARLSICLLGSFRVTVDGHPATGFISDKARALLAYLAVESDRMHRREHLAGLLWPDYPDRDAANSLRTALASVRRAIEDHQANPACLDVSRQAVQFNLSGDAWIDAVALTRLLPAGSYPRQPGAEAICQWQEAVDLYTGRFLAGFSIADGPPFEEWALLQQERLERQVLEALDRLAEWHEGHGQVEQALVCARRQVDLDPLRESAHRQVMRLLAMGGRRAAALAHYEGCRRLLQEELDAEPDLPTRALYEQIRAGKIQARPAISVPHPAYTPPLPPEPGTLPEPGILPPGARLPFTRNALFSGRHEPLLALARAFFPDGPKWLHAPTDTAPVAQVITGMGGIGKTQLAVEFAYRCGPFLHGVHWLSCAEPDLIPAEIAACGLKMQLTPWPDDLPGQVERTLAAWRGDASRLVILDNLEDIPAARSWLAQFSGPLRLLLTTRHSDWPADLGLAFLPLPLLSPPEAVALLRRHLPDHSRFPDPDLAALAGRLGHLPLALQLAGRYLGLMPRLTARAYLDGLASVLASPAMCRFRTDLGDPVGHDLELAATFYRSWQQVAGDAGARRLFLTAGYCAPNQPIPGELLACAAGLDPAACDAAVARLAGLGLLDLSAAAPSPGAGRALAIRERSLGRENLDTAATLKEIGLLERDSGCLPQARRCLEEALTILQKTLPPDHPTIRAVRGDLESLARPNFSLPSNAG